MSNSRKLQFRHSLTSEQLEEADINEHGFYPDDGFPYSWGFSNGFSDRLMHQTPEKAYEHFKEQIAQGKLTKKMMNTLEFSINSDVLKKHVKLLNQIVSRNPIVPILENLLFSNALIESGDSFDGLLYLVASDLQTSMSVELKVKRLSGFGTPSFCINASKLLKLLSRLPKQELTFTFNGESKVTVVTESKQGKYNFYSENPVDFPKIPTLTNPEQLTTTGEVLRRALVPTLVSTSTDDLRSAMTGVFFDGQSLVSSDGHRLTSIIDRSLQSPQMPFIVPRHTCRLLLNALKGYSDKVAIDVTNTQSKITDNSRAGNVSFWFNNIKIISSLIDERFPNYQSAIPTDYIYTATFSRQGMIDILDRITLFANATTHQVRFSITNSKIVVSAEDMNNSQDGQEEINAINEGIGTKEPFRFEIGFNARLLLETLKVMPETHVQMQIIQPNRACVMYPHNGEINKDFMCLIMPVALNTYA